MSSTRRTVRRLSSAFRGLRGFHHRDCPNVKPKRFRALIIAINYTNVNESQRKFLTALNCHEDALCIKKLLIETYGYKDADITMMMDKEGVEDALSPTKDNILRAMDDFVSDSKAGDSFVLYYAGHSGQIKALKDKHETDKMDEYIISVDGEKIIDDTIRERLVKPLNAQARLSAIFDACHSGTMLDLSNDPHPVERSNTYPGDHRSHEKEVFRRPTLPDSFRLPVHLDKWGFVASLLKARRTPVRIRQQGLQPVEESEGSTYDKPLNICEGMSTVDYNNQVKIGDDDVILAGSSTNIWCRVCSRNARDYPLVLSLSSCLDQQEAVEFSEDKHGLMTQKLCELLGNKPEIPVEDIRRNIQDKVFEAIFRRIVESCEWAKVDPEFVKKRTRKIEKLFLKLPWQYLQIGSERSRYMMEPFLVKVTS